MITPKTDLGHWHCDFEIPYPRPFGFLYVIVNKLDYRRYIGCKQFCFQRKSQRVESDWRTYTSSSKNLKADIKKLGKENFHFEILSLHSSKSSLAYYETKLIFETDAIISPDYYNAFVRCKIFGNRV
jgi:hypothetical protein